MQLKMLTLCLSGRRCEQGTWCEKIRDAENQTVTPNTSTSHTQTGNLCYKHSNMANDLAEARPVPAPDPLIKDLLTFPLQHIHLSSLPHTQSGCKHVHFMSFTRVWSSLCSSEVYTVAAVSDMKADSRSKQEHLTLIWVNWPFNHCCTKQDTTDPLRKIVFQVKSRL